jgi:hypothetical protein
LDVFKISYINAAPMSRPLAMRWGIRPLAALCALVALAGAADAAELVMYRRDGCPWCALWDREIGPIYPRTDIGRRLPLRLVDLDRGAGPAIRIHRPIRYTPTFLLVDAGREVGRIEGYPGDAFFWGLLERLLGQLPSRRPSGVSTPGIDHAAKLERTL